MRDQALSPTKIKLDLSTEENEGHKQLHNKVSAPNPSANLSYFCFQDTTAAESSCSTAYSEEQSAAAAAESAAAKHFMSRSKYEGRTFQYGRSKKENRKFGYGRPDRDSDPSKDCGSRTNTGYTPTPTTAPTATETSATTADQSSSRYEGRKFQYGRTQPETAKFDYSQSYKQNSKFSYGRKDNKQTSPSNNHGSTNTQTRANVDASATRVSFLVCTWL